MKRYKTFIVGLVFFSLNVIGQATSIKTSTISGIVTDVKVNEPIPFANVILFEKETQIAITQSDFDGKYIFKNIEHGVYNIKASYLGMEIESKKVFLTKSKHVENLEISTASILDEIVISCYPIITCCRIGCPATCSFDVCGYASCLVMAVDTIEEEIEEPEPVEIKCNMSVYPNPSYGDFTLDVEEPGKEVFIFDMTGEIVFTKKVIDEYNGQVEDLSTLNRGMYIVKYGDGLDKCTQKIVLKTRGGSSIASSPSTLAYY